MARCSFSVGIPSIHARIRYFKSFRVSSGPVAPETPDGISNSETSLPAKWSFRTDRHHAQRCSEQLPTQRRFTCNFLKTTFPSRFTSHFADIAWPARSPHLVPPDYFIWGYIREGARNTLPVVIT